jgi:hypothetical protein
MASKRWLSLGSSIVVAAVGSLFVITATLAIAPPADASIGAVVRPVILQTQATSRSLPDTGGVVRFSLKLRNVDACKLEVVGTPTVATTFSKAWQRCSSGVFRDSVTF